MRKKSASSFSETSHSSSFRYTTSFDARRLCLFCGAASFVVHRVSIDREPSSSSSSSSSSFSCGALCVGRLIAREEKTLLRSHRIHQNSLGKWTPTPTPLDKIRLIRTTSNTTPGLNTVTVVMVTKRDTIRTTTPIARRDEEEEEEAGINEST